MSKAGVSGYNSNLSAVFYQRQQDLASLANAVQSGDIGSAQQALASYQQDAQNLKSAIALPTFGEGLDGSAASFITGFSSTNSPENAFQTVVNALQSGDIGGAANSNTAPQSTFSQDLNAFLQDVQQGNITGAQTAATTVQNDLLDISQSGTSTVGGQGHHHHHHFAMAGAVGTATDTSSDDPSTMSHAPTSSTNTASGNLPTISAATANTTTTVSQQALYALFANIEVNTSNLSTTL